jgi:mRNA interferase HicA
MKRRKLIHHLTTNGCHLLREGKKHSVYVNTTNMKVSTVPRHEDISDHLAKKICTDLNIECVEN